MLDGRRGLSEYYKYAVTMNNEEIKMLCAGRVVITGVVPTFNP